MSIPQGSSTISSIGQKTVEDGGTNTNAVSIDTPLLEFGSVTPLGVAQKPSRETSTLMISVGDQMNQSAIEQTNSPLVPSGATIRPRLRVVAPGRITRLKTRQLWYGTVTEINDQGFVAILSDKTNPENPDEQASFEFDLSEISPEDLQLVSLGSSFYWTIGTELSVARQVTNVSRLEFRRMPRWTKSSLARAKNNADQIRELFGKEA